MAPRGLFETTGRYASEHAFCTQIFVDVRPMNSVPITNQLPVRLLGRGRLGKAPGPYKRDAEPARLRNAWIFGIQLNHTPHHFRLSTIFQVRLTLRFSRGAS